MAGSRERIQGYIDRDNFRSDTDFAKAQIQELSDSYTKLANTRIDLSKSLGGRNIAATLKSYNDELQTNIRLTSESARTTATSTKATNDDTVARQKQVSAFQQLKSEYKEADTALKNAILTYGEFSNEAQAAADKVAGLKEQLDRVNSAAKNASAPAAPQVESVSNIPSVEDVEATGEAVNQLDKDQADAAMSAIEWANAQKAAASASNDVKNAVDQTATSVEEEKTYFSDILGSINGNIEAYEENAAALRSIKAEQKALADEIKKSGGATDAQRKKAADLAVQYKQLDETQKGLKKTIDNQIKAETSEAGSITQLRAKLALLTQEYQNLGAAAQKSDTGVALKAEIDKISPALNKAEQSIGQFQRNVGNYASGIQGFASKTFSAVRQLANILPGIGLAGIFGLIGEQIVELVKDLDLFKSKFDAIGEVNRGATKDIASNGAELLVLKDRIEDTNLSLDQRQKLLNQLKADHPAYAKTLQAEFDATGKLTKGYEKLSKQLVLNAKIKAITQKIDENQKKLLDAETGSVTDNLKGYQKLTVGVLGSLGLVNNAFSYATNAAVGNLKKLRDETETNTKALEELLKKLNPETIVEDDKKGKGDETKQQFNDILLKYEQEYQEQLSEIVQGGEKNRLDARAKAYELELKIIVGKYKVDLANAKGNAAELQRINDQFWVDKINAESKYNTDLLKIKASNAQAQAQAEKDAAQVSVEYQAAAEKAKQDAQKKAADDLKNAYTSRENFEKEARDINLAANERALKDGSVSYEEYEKRKLDITNSYEAAILKIQISYLEIVIASQKAAGQEISKQEADLAALKLKLAESTNKGLADADKKRLKEETDIAKKKSELYKQLANEMLNLFQAIGDAQFENQKNALQDQIDLIDQRKEKEIDAINASTDTEQEKADKIAVINAQADAQQDVLRQKQKKEDQKKAEFDKAMSIVKIIASTAEAVMASLAQTPPPEGLPLAAIIAAVGAAQIAIVAATPIPKYAKGTDDHKGGLAILGDGGKHEIALLPDGSAFASPSTDTLYNLPAHTQVFPSLDNFNKTVERMNHKPVTLADTVNDNMMVAMMQQHAAQFNKMEKGIVNAINNKRELHIKGTWGGFEAASKFGNRWNEYLDKNVRF